MSHAPLRDDVANLLVELAGRTDLDAAGLSGCLRHLGIAGLNLATEADCKSLVAVCEALPWLAAYIRWHREQGDARQVITLLEEGGLLDHIGTDHARRRLQLAARKDSPAVRRAPEGIEHAESAPGPEAEALVELFDDNRRLDTLTARPVDERRDELLADGMLLATALQQRTSEAPEGPAAGVVPPWSIDSAVRPLEVLGRFERNDFDAVPGAWTMLGERSRRFEQSLATHLAENGVLIAVRAALAFAPLRSAAPVDSRAIRRFLAGFSVFADDPALLKLAEALIDVRHRPVGYLTGALPLEALSGWLAYLRGPCSEFAESRGITPREAINFAHYALHLVDLCDLGAVHPPLTDPIRRAVMDVEDELKEFVLVGRSDDASRRAVDLRRYEQTRWNQEARPRAMLADRLARLSGAWRSGHRPGPPGGAFRPDDELFETFHNLVCDEDATELDAVLNLLGRARLRGVDVLQSWPPHRVVALVERAVLAARHSQIDTTASFVVDFSPLSRWLEEGDAKRRAELIDTLVQLHDPTEPGSDHPGLTMRVADRRLSVGFGADAEVEALLTLLADAQDEAFEQMLTDRLRDRLTEGETPAHSPSRESTPSPPARTDGGGSTSTDANSSEDDPSQLPGS